MIFHTTEFSVIKIGKQYEAFVTKVDERLKISRQTPEFLNI